MSGTSAKLVFHTGTAIHNAGLLEATGGGTLQVNDDVANSGTLLASGSGSVVDLESVTVTNTATAAGTVGGGSAPHPETAIIAGGTVTNPRLLGANTGTTH